MDRFGLGGGELRTELLFIPLLIALGGINIAFGEEFLPNFKGMGLFLLPAIGGFTTALFVLRTPKEGALFFRFFSGILLLLCLYGIWQFQLTGFKACHQCAFEDAHNILFTSNPIPAGVTLLCLFAGPAFLFVLSRSQTEKICLAVLFFLGVVLIILLGQRAAIISIPVMVAFLGFFLNKRYTYSIFVLAVFFALFFALGYLFLDYLPLFIQLKINAIAKVPIFRLEMYHFALHIFKESPLLGIGIWTPLEKYLWNYDNLAFINSPIDFYNLIWLIQTNTSFHNMILYLFVHAGSLFTIAYIFFIISILGNLIKKCTKFPVGKKLTIFYFAWLIGLLVPALNVDLLMYPDINFLFHSMLGLAPNLHLIVPFKK